MAAALLAACHPAPTAAVTTVAALLGVGVGLDAGSVALLTSAVLTGQLSVGWSNDALDVARDRVSGRQDKPAATGRVSARALWRAAGLAGVATVALSVLLGAGVVHLLLPAAGWAYNFGLKGTWWSAAAYAVGFGALPATPFLMLDGSLPPWWAPTAGALLGVGAHVANVLPDVRADVATDVRGLPHRIGLNASTALMAGALLTAVAVTAFGPNDIALPFAVASTALATALAVAAVAAVRRSPESRVPFPLVLVLALLVAAQFAAGV